MTAGDVVHALKPQPPPLPPPKKLRLSPPHPTPIPQVTAEDVLHALKRYIVPLFDPLANVSVACPANKRDQISSYLTDRGCNVLPVPEEKLIGTFGGRLGAEAAAANGGSVAAPERVKGSSKFLPGAFAKQFVCGCPRCIEPGSSKRDN